MRRYRPLILLLACVVCLVHAPCVMTGCRALETEWGQYRTAADTWAAVKNSAADAWEAGHLDRSQKKKVMKWTRRGDEALAEWREQLGEGGPTKGSREMLLRATNILRQVWMKAQNSTSSGKTQSQNN